MDKKLQELYDQYKKLKGYDNGGKVNNPDLENHYRAADGYYDGDQVEPSAMSNLASALANAFGSPTPTPPPQPSLDQKYQQIRQQNASNMNYSEGGDVSDPVTGDIDPNSPEGLAMIAAADYPQAPQMDKEDDVTGAPQIVNADAAKLSDVEDKQDPDDKALENEVANEDFEAGEKSDEPASKEEVVDKDDEDDSGDDEDETDVADKKEQEERSPASDENDQSSLSGLLSSLKPQQANSLQDAQKQRDQAIANAQLERGAAIMGAGLTGRNVNNQQVLNAISDKEKYANLPVQKYDEVVANQKNDPDSPMSQATRQYFASKGIKVPDNASASDILTVAPFYAKDAGLQSAMQRAILGSNTKLLTNANSVSAANQRADAKNAILEKELKVKQDMANLAHQNKGSNDQNKSLTQTQQMLESARGNPAAAQAEKDLYSTQKANSLINMYGDPNKLSPQQVNLLVSEISKIATGGVPTGHEQAALQPGTVESKLASLWSKLSNDPSPANAGAFIKQFKDYNDALAKDAQKTIEDKYGRIIETRKKQLGDDNYQSLQDQYVNRFKKANSSQAQHKPGDMVQYKGQTYRVGQDGNSLEEIQ